MQTSPACCLAARSQHCPWDVSSCIAVCVRCEDTFPRVTSGDRDGGVMPPLLDGAAFGGTSSLSTSCSKTPSRVSTMSGCFQTTPVAVLIQCQGALSTQYLGTEGAHLLALPPGVPGRGPQESRQAKLFLFSPNLHTVVTVSGWL